MTDNQLSYLPHPVRTPTNDMAAFPDATSAVTVDKVKNPSGNAYKAGDKNGFILFNHDITADGAQTPMVNYVAARYTKGTYTVDSQGTVTQVTTGHIEPMPAPAPTLSPAPAPKPVTTETQRSGEEAAIMVLERLQNLAKTREAKEYVALLFPSSIPSPKYMGDLRAWEVVLAEDSHFGSRAGFEAADWFQDDYDQHFAGYEGLIWLVYGDGRVMPFAGGALKIEIDIEQLNTTRMLGKKGTPPAPAFVPPPTLAPTPAPQTRDGPADLPVDEVVTLLPYGTHDNPTPISQKYGSVTSGDAHLSASLALDERQVIKLTLESDVPIDWDSKGSWDQPMRAVSVMFAEMRTFVEGKGWVSISSSAKKVKNLYITNDTKRVEVILSPDDMAGCGFEPPGKGLYKLIAVNRDSVQSHYLRYTMSLVTTPAPTPVPTAQPAPGGQTLNIRNQAKTLVLNRLVSLAKTSDGKQFLAEFQSSILEMAYLVFDSKGASHEIGDYQGQDIQSYLVEFAFPEKAYLSGVLGKEVEAWPKLQENVKVCRWVVELDSTVRPIDRNAYRVESVLTFPMNTSSWTYPELHQLGVSGTPDFFHQTVPRKDLENAAWEPAVLEKKVRELAVAYERANPYVEPNHVCRHMAAELWQILKDNDITSLVVAGNTQAQNEWKIKFECDHVWLVVLGPDNLNLAIECTAGLVYAPSYMRAYELDCERTYREYGTSSLQWQEARNLYDQAYAKYQQYLEGYFYGSPTAFYGSQLFLFFPSNW